MRSMFERIVLIAAVATLSSAAYGEVAETGAAGSPGVSASVGETAEQGAKKESQANLHQIDTRIFRLENASAEEVAEKLNEMWNGDFGQIWKVKKIAVPFQESNAVIVTAPDLFSSTFLGSAAAPDTCGTAKLVPEDVL